MKRPVFFLAALLLLLSAGIPAKSQQYKLRQVTNMMGMKSESTIYVKGMRKRTEAGAMMGMPAPPVVIEQCDLQRYIKINDKKKLYFIEPFAKEEVIEEEPTAPKTKPVTKPPVEKTQKGGVITMYYNITDTGERKKMYGFTARHVWTTQKIKGSPDACTMKDSMMIKTDGWYIDLPQFNCPVRYTSAAARRPQDPQKPDCIDRFVTRRSGKGKLGFPLIETTTMIMGDGTKSTNTFETNLETLELTMQKLDSMLFEIPPGYKLAASEDELQEKMDINSMMEQYKNMGKENNDNLPVNPAGNMGNTEKAPGAIRIGVFEPKGGDGQLQTSQLQQFLAGNLQQGNIEAIAVSSEEEARSKQCDYTLGTDITKMKSGSKVGGLLKVIKNSDPNAASSFTIDATMTLIKLADGSVKLKPAISGKYDGKPDAAAQQALEEGSRQVLKGLK